MGNRSARANRSARGTRTQGGKGVQVGRNNTQYNLFAGPPPPGPVVAGNIPQAPSAFQPREDLMARLRAAGPGLSVVRAVTGMRGVGKTQLAAAYGRECINRGWRLVAWINAEDNPGILNGLAVVADRLGIDKPGTALGTIGAEVRNRLEADGERCLVIFDNVMNLDAVRPYVPAAGRAQVIITSTDTTTRMLGKPLAVDVFTEEESLDFLAERTEQEDPAGASTVAEELGHLPLALAQAAAVIQAQRLDYPTYLERLRNYPVQDYLPPAKNDPYPRGVAEAILLSIDAITADDRTGLCRDLLLFVSLLSPDGISRDLLHLAGSIGAVPEAHRSRVSFRKRGLGNAVSPQTIDTALGRLAEASLLTYNRSDASGGPLVSAHRLVRRVVRERGDRESSLDATALRVCAALTAACDPLDDPDQQHRAPARALVRHIVALNDYVNSRTVSASRALADVMLTHRAWAMSTLTVLEDNAAEAIKLGEPLVDDCGRRLGTRHPSTLAARIFLARAYDWAGQYEAAIFLLERTLEDRIRVLGADHPDTLVSRSDLGNAYKGAGQAGEAVSMLEVCVAGEERIHGADHPATLVTQANLGEAYRLADRLEESIPLLERALAGQVRMLADEHPHTLQTQTHLGAAYTEAGRLDEAVSLLEGTLADMTRVLGDEHPGTLSAQSCLAEAYARAGRFREAISLYEQALSVLRRTLGEEHPSTVTARTNLAAARQRARTTRPRPRR